MKLKVGDKVRIIKFPELTNMIGKICEVIEIPIYSPDYACRVKSRGWECLMYEQEIEKVSEKGKQLEFAFMEQ